MDAQAKPARAADFQNSTTAFSRLGDPQTAPILKFERADWALFRTIEGLAQKAGVPPHKLAKLVLKELADNALDECDHAHVGMLDDDGGFFVEDDGGGIDPDEVARLFSIARPLVSTKLLRLPTRGALGNGLRVVAGAVLASGGTLTVTTRNRRLELRPEFDGTTTVISTAEVEFPTGTRVEISFGSALPASYQTLGWAQLACGLAQGKIYAGRSSPHWYDPAQFHELVVAGGNTPVRELIANLDGCTGGTAGEIVAAARLGRAVCNTISRRQAEVLLKAAREHAKPVTAERLGAIGAEAFPHSAYAMATGVTEFGSVAPVAAIPFVVEAWAERMEGEAADADTTLTVCVNRSPITGEIHAAHRKRDIDAFGCGLSHTIATAPIGAEFFITLNVITPFMPITSDGKEPNLKPFLTTIMTVAEKAVRKAHRPTAETRVSQKDIVFDNLDDAIATVSGDAQFRFTERQVLYVVRKVVHDEIGETLTTTNFKGIITDYEAEYGEIPLMYREPRGSIYHPHRGETITLGTLMVEDYERPAWTFNKLVYIEKEGFSEALKEVRWAERHDCMLMSSKGFTTRAARDLVDKLAEHDEPVTVFCVHDADGHGTTIFQTFQEATRARGARKIRIVNLGLEPWEAIAMGLEVEEIEPGKKRRPVADYVLKRTDRAPDGTKWEKWLQTHRVELNAMTTPAFIEWLDGKLADYDKLIPPPEILAAELNARVEDKLRAAIIERVLREANVDGQVADAIAQIETPDSTALTAGVKQLFKVMSDAHWRDHIEAVANELTGGSDEDSEVAS
jgi:hypothetical protein